MPNLDTGLRFFSKAVTTVVNVNPNQGKLYFLDIFNSTAAVAFLQIFNAQAANVVLGTTVPDLSIGIPASAARSVDCGELGLDMTVAITVAGTTTRTGSTTAELDCNFGYL